MKKQSVPQQVLIGIIIVISVIMTLLGGVILAFAENPALSGGVPAATRGVTVTPIRLSTLPPTATSGGTPVAVGPTIVTLPPDTPLPASATPSPTSTFLPTPTRTISPTPTDPPTSTSSALVTITPCHIPQGWLPYSVQPGDTLFRIGLKYGLTVDQLMKANCLTSAHIDAGDTLYVPPVTPKAVPTSAGDDPPITPIGTQTVGEGACTCSGSVISRPQPGALLRGSVDIIGTASIPDFLFYKLEIRPSYGTEDDYITLFSVQQPVTNGLLGKVDTAAWPDGQYWIRLTVVNVTYNYPERCARLYAFDN